LSLQEVAVETLDAVQSIGLGGRQGARGGSDEIVDAGWRQTKM